MSAAGLLAIVGFVAGSALLAACLRWSFPAIPKRVALVLIAVPALFWGPALASGGTTLWTSAVYTQRPWRGMPVPAGAPRSTLASDPVLQMLPFRALARERLLRLEPPLWAPELGSGQALLGNAQSAVFSPLELLARPWPPLRAATVVAGWQTVVAGLLAAALALALGTTPSGAALAGIAYSLSLGLLVWSHYPLGGALAWMPGVLAAIVGLRSRSPRSEAGLVLTATALALSGHPETLAHTALVGFACAVVCVVSVGRAERLRLAVSLLRAAVLAFCLSAPATLPVLGELSESARARKLALAEEAARPVAFQAPMLAPIASPFVFGNPRFGGWRGPWNFFEVASIYPGFLPLVLALGGALALRDRGRWLVVAALVALLVALDLPPLRWMLASVPWLGESAIGRVRLVWVLGVALAAGWSVDRVAASRTSRAAVLAVTVALALTAVLLTAHSPLPTPSARLQTVTAALGGLLVAGCALVPRLRPRLAIFGAAALSLELLVVGWLVTPVLPASLELEPPAGFRAAIASALEERPDVPPRFAAMGWDAHPNLAVLWGLWDVRGNDPMRPWAPAAVLSRQVTGVERQQELTRLSRIDEPLLDFWGVRFLLTPRRLAPGAGWRTLFEQGVSRLSERLAPAPLFRFEQGAVLAGDREQAIVMGAGRCSSADRRVVVETPALTGAAGRGGVARLRPIANGFELELAPGSSGLLASSVSWGRSWKASADGRPLQVERVDGAFVGLVVPGGTRLVRLVYAPPSFGVGLALGAVGVAALLGAFVRSAGIRRRNQLSGAASSRSASASPTRPS